MSLTTKAVGSVMTKGGNLLPAAIGGAATIGTGMKAVCRVPEGSVGLVQHRERPRRKRNQRFGSKKRGELYGVVEPGFKVVMPFFSDVATVSLQSKTNRFEDLTIDITRNEKQFIVQAAMTWGVVRRYNDDGSERFSAQEYGEFLYKAIYGSQEGEYAQNVVAAAGAGFREVVSQMNDPRSLLSEQVTLDRNEDSIPLITENVMRSCGSLLLNSYGAEIRLITVNDVHETSASMMAHAIRSSGGPLVIPSQG